MTFGQNRSNMDSSSIYKDAQYAKKMYAIVTLNAGYARRMSDIANLKLLIAKDKELELAYKNLEPIFDKIMEAMNAGLYSVCSDTKLSDLEIKILNDKEFPVTKFGSPDTYDIIHWGGKV